MLWHLNGFGADISVSNYGLLMRPTKSGVATSTFMGLVAFLLPRPTPHTIALPYTSCLARFSASLQRLPVSAAEMPGIKAFTGFSLSLAPLVMLILERQFVLGHWRTLTLLHVWKFHSIIEFAPFIAGHAQLLGTALC